MKVEQEEKGHGAFYASEREEEDLLGTDGDTLGLEPRLLMHD